MLKGAWRAGLAVVLVAGVLGPAPGAVADIDQPGGDVQGALKMALVI